ncbi:MAG TPA: transglycosylase domain-containing protein [Trebonia sp.]|jgi:membrane peptidoglycan carboxypeptidase|nr:transglycosylase domain-containing protein [Trebonia sp.]
MYPAPEGWANDGFWKDPGIDADYETGLIGTARQGSRGRAAGDGGYSYWSDGQGWRSSPSGSAPGNGRGAAGPSGARPDPFATRADPFGARAQYGGGGQQHGAGDQATAFYGAGPSGPPGPDGPGGGYDGPRGPGGPGGRRRPGGPGGPGGRGRQPGRVKGSWWRHWTWKKALGVVGGMAGMVILVLVGTYFYLYNTTQIPTTLASDVLAQNSTVYYSDGKTPIGTIGPVNRQLLTFSQIPKAVQDAVLAAEDRSFWTEGGISPTGIIRAAYDDITSSGGNLAGGSTITQEFVRHYYDNIGTQQTISRKVKEIFVAMKLAKAKSKQWILTNYLNTIFLGDNSYGIAAAARTYFGVPVSQLTIAQAAVIAAIIQQPSNYPLPQYRSDLIARWHYVLNGMVRMGDLTAAQAASLKFPRLLTDSKTGGSTQNFGTSTSKDPWAPYIMNVVYNELTGVDHVSPATLETGGLKIVTTISRPMEVELYNAVNENIAAIKASGYSLPSYAMIGAELQNPSNGAIVAMYPGRGQNMSPAQCKIYDCDLNTAIYAREQVGSSFKPYVLATAVSQGMNVQTSILNASPQLWVPPDTMPMVLSATSAAKAVPNAYPVHNDGYEVIGGRGGATTVQNALAQSSNTAFTDLAHRVGTENIIQMAGNFGVNLSPYSEGGSGLPSYRGEVGMALGIAPMTVNEQATMLSTIANGGTYHSAHIIQSYQAPSGPVVPGVVSQHVVLTPDQDSQVQYAMEATTVDGTGTAASLGPDRPIIGKTGTTTNSKSAFFIGAIPQWTFVVGIFTQSQDPNSPETLTALGGGGFGGTWPANIWHTFMSQVTSNLPVEQFLTPVFTGEKWNQVGNLPPVKKKQQKKHQAPTPAPTPPGQGPGQGQPGQGQGPGQGPGQGQGPFGSPAAGPGASPTATPAASDTPPASGIFSGQQGGVQAGGTG